MTDRRTRSTAGRSATGTDHRIRRTAHGLRVFAVLVGVAVISARARPRR